MVLPTSSYRIMERLTWKGFHIALLVISTIVSKSSKLRVHQYILLNYLFNHQKMIVYGLLVGGASFDAAVQSDKGSKSPLDRVVETICQSFAGVQTDEHVQLQIIKVRNDRNFNLPGLSNG